MLAQTVPPERTTTILMLRPAALSAEAASTRRPEAILMRILLVARTVLLARRTWMVLRLLVLCVPRVSIRTLVQRVALPVPLVSMTMTSRLNA
jgi:hypothetical protein